VGRANVYVSDHGLNVDESESHPAGTLFSGGYDAETNDLYLSGVLGHPRGVSLAGGDPSKPSVSGLRVLIVENGDVYWAADSMSLPRDIHEADAMAVQAGLERHFQNRTVRKANTLEDIPRH
jgi:hypothetical protein